MRNVILVSHGDMAEGVKMSLEMIMGKQEHVHTVSLAPDGDNIQFENDLKLKMKTLNGSIIIIADLLGGTPCNVAVKNFLNREDVQIIAGLSLPLAVEATLNSEATPEQLVKSARDSAVDVKAKLNQKEEAEEKVNPVEDLSLYAAYEGKANIVNTRIDERLIHGQVAGIWSTSLNTQRIIVANDEAAADPLQKSSLRMAAPTSMRLSVLPVTEAAQNINSGKYGTQRIFLLFKNPTDVLRFLEAGGSIDRVNVGNMSFKEGARLVTKSIQVMPDEEKVFESIAAKRVEVTAQLVPNDPSIDFMEKLRS